MEKLKNKKMEYYITVEYCEEGEGKEPEQIEKELQAWTEEMFRKYSPRP